jgi:hypothetical protein
VSVFPFQFDAVLTLERVFVGGEEGQIGCRFLSRCQNVSGNLIHRDRRLDLSDIVIVVVAATYYRERYERNREPSPHRKLLLSIQ